MLLLEIWLGKEMQCHVIFTFFVLRTSCSMHYCMYIYETGKREEKTGNMEEKDWEEGRKRLGRGIEK